MNHFNNKGIIMKNKLNTAIVSLFVAVAATSMTAVAAESSQGYVGISYSKVDIDTGISSPTGTAVLDEKDNSIKLFAGLNIDENLAVEAHYIDFGEASLSGNNGDTFVEGGVTYQFLTTASIKVEAESYGVSGLYKFNVGNDITPFVKLGLHKWEAKATVNAGSVTGSGTVDGTDPFYGLGVSASVFENIDIRAEFERFEADSEDIDYKSIGVAYNF
jgi:OOP family OmpA-OmpF porin